MLLSVATILELHLLPLRGALALDTATAQREDFSADPAVHRDLRGAWMTGDRYAVTPVANASYTLPAFTFPVSSFPETTGL